MPPKKRPFFLPKASFRFFPPQIFKKKKKGNVPFFAKIDKKNCFFFPLFGPEFF